MAPPCAKRSLPARLCILAIDAVSGSAISITGPVNLRTRSAAEVSPATASGFASAKSMFIPEIRSPGELADYRLFRPNVRNTTSASCAIIPTSSKYPAGNLSSGPKISLSWVNAGKASPASGWEVMSPGPSRYPMMGIFRVLVARVAIALPSKLY